MAGVTTDMVTFAERGGRAIERVARKHIEHIGSARQPVNAGDRVRIGRDVARRSP